MSNYDIVLLTESRYEKPKQLTDYVRNVLQEDKFVQDALENAGLRTSRLDWATPDFDWSTTRYVLFRTTWDYFDRFAEFSAWLKRVTNLTKLINPASLIYWNIDKHYLQDLEKKGINITPTHFVKAGTETTLEKILSETGWKDAVIKPAISGSARHTYKLNFENYQQFENIFQSLVSKEAMLLQPFQQDVVKTGERAFMLIDGKFTHAVLKTPKAGDFRVQDDHGGTVRPYAPADDEVEFVEKAMAACHPLPVYGRVDVITGNDGQSAVSEIELIEPEMWFRFYPPAANKMAEAIKKRFF
ncbi:MAG: hypothetical protein SH857_11455 [Chitinophagales bacterium]|nr:hypothetical protein [Chitinophagales bacterium]